MSGILEIYRDYFDRDYLDNVKLGAALQRIQKKTNRDTFPAKLTAKLVSITASDGRIRLFLHSL